jgi:cytidylate kinase
MSWVANILGFTSKEGTFNSPEGQALMADNRFMTGADAMSSVANYHPAIATAVAAKIRATAVARQSQFRAGRLPSWVATLGQTNLERYLQGLPVERTADEKAAAKVIYGTKKKKFIRRAGKFKRYRRFYGGRKKRFIQGGGDKGGWQAKRRKYNA